MNRNTPWRNAFTGPASDLAPSSLPDRSPQSLCYFFFSLPSAVVLRFADETHEAAQFVQPDTNLEPVFV